MAVAPAHKFGQIVGNVLELSIYPLLLKFAQEHDLFLDKQGPRPARKGRKVAWEDINGNEHDLDYVIERGGTQERIGTPVAFIEIAWRRYTKHSRNKAQEIQGAILPLAQKYKIFSPFLGVVVSGVFTNAAVEQLRSVGFSVLYFPYKTIIDAFEKTGIDADFNEKTSDAEIERKIHLWTKLSSKKRTRVALELLEINSKEISQFMKELELSVKRKIGLIRVFPLHGKPCDWNSAQEAVTFINNYKDSKVSLPFVKFEIEIRYTNGGRISCEFENKIDAVEFLDSIASIC